jgi:hypothetical protein
MTFINNFFSSFVRLVVHSVVSVIFRLLQAHLRYKITSNKIRPKVKIIRSKWCKTDKVLEMGTPAPTNCSSDRHRFFYCVLLALFQSVRPSVQIKTSFRHPKLSKAKVVDAMVDHGQNGCLSGYT